MVSEDVINLHHPYMPGALDRRCAALTNPLPGCERCGELDALNATMAGPGNSPSEPWYFWAVPLSSCCLRVVIWVQGVVTWVKAW